jgi:hypothetical protein
MVRGLYSRVPLDKSKNRFLIRFQIKCSISQNPELDYNLINLCGLNHKSAKDFDFTDYTVQMER